MTYRRGLVISGLELVKIDQIHRGDHVTNQRDFGDFRLATHRGGNRDRARRLRALGLSGIQQTRREEPAPNGNVAPALATKSADRLRG